ncbi:MAG: PD40 domain-containing protein [Acidobacteria bacterium]|nr:PD40 domain-containing protein [Acidobacteriota bacterium]
MSLARGTRLGPYEIVGILGSGGMGDVYRARDTRLGRDVAVKVLPSDRVYGSQGLRCLELESRAAGQLNHPNILSIYDVGTHDGAPYVVSELLEGETLRVRMKGGPLSVKAAIDHATQIADGLAAAHEKGIVHRDLKPENLFVTQDGRVKILDFGLAKLTLPQPHGTEETGSWGSANGTTSTGIIVGSAGYMSPEQAAGRHVGTESDQFSLGLVLYEMLTGARAFERPSAAETLSAIIREEPVPIRRLDPHVPAPGRWVVDRCLAKEPRDRFACTRDLALTLRTLRDRLSEDGEEETIGAVRVPERPRPTGRYLLAAGLILVAGLAGAGIAVWKLRRPAADVPGVHYITNSGHDSAPAASPDGHTIAFTSDRDGEPRIWLKELSRGIEVPLTSGPDDYARFSRDGQMILFSRTEGGVASLYRVATLGGEPRRLIENVFDGDWSPDGAQVVFVRRTIEKGVTNSAIGIAAADGSGARLIAEFADQALQHPRWSPNGRTIAAVSAAQPGGTVQPVFLVDVDGKNKRVVRPPYPTGRLSCVAWCGSGEELIYSQAESIVASITGAGARVIRQNPRTGAWRSILWSPNHSDILDIIAPGRILFDMRSSRENLQQLTLLRGAPQPVMRWLTRGNSSDRQPVYSSDGEWIVFSSNGSGNLDLWSISTKTGAVRRITDDQAEDWDPAFTRDGKSIIWSSNRGGHFEIWIASPDGSNARQLTRDGANAENPTATPDGLWVFYNSNNPKRNGIWKIRANGEDATRIVAGRTLLPEVSPDGAYILYLVDYWTERTTLRVARTGDGSSVPFEIKVGYRRRRNVPMFTIGRARWMPDGHAIAFVGQNDKGLEGIFVQDFVPGRETSATCRPLGGFEPGLATESFGISPDGTRLAVAGWEQLFGLMTAEELPEITPPQRPR